jgi:hypothetical protein
MPTKARTEIAVAIIRVKKVENESFFLIETA